MTYSCCIHSHGYDRRRDRAKDGNSNSISQALLPLVRIPLSAISNANEDTHTDTSTATNNESGSDTANSNTIVSAKQLNDIFEQHLNRSDHDNGHGHGHNHHHKSSKKPQDASSANGQAATTAAAATPSACSPVSIKLSYDAGLLHCETSTMIRHKRSCGEVEVDVNVDLNGGNDKDVGMNMKYTLWGIEENQALFSGRNSRRELKEQPLQNDEYYNLKGCNDNGNEREQKNDDETTKRFYEYEYDWRDASDLKVIVEGYRAQVDEIKDMNMDGNMDRRRDIKPQFDWTRPKNSRDVNTETDGGGRFKNNVDAVNVDARVKIIDLTNVQRHRRMHGSATTTQNGQHLSMDTPGSVCHLLRSVLKCGGTTGCKTEPVSTERFGVHCASPWREVCVSKDSTFGHDEVGESMKKKKNFNHAMTAVECDHTDQVIALLLCNKLDDSDNYDDFMNNDLRPLGDRYYWDELERRELNRIANFRTGDACPNYYLHSTVGLTNDFCLEDLVSSSLSKKRNHGKTTATRRHKVNKDGLTLFVYRHLPKRKFSSSMTYPGSSPTTGSQKHDGCLWEKIRTPSSSSSANQTNGLVKRQGGHEYTYRMVAPPYQEHNDLFGTLFQTILSPQNIQILKEEALRIPQWTAWPERNHYQSDYDKNRNSNGDDVDTSAYPASWTVFPLCHTFPAHDVSMRKWISLTCNYVPQTTQLLQSLGPYVRTALFSRLEPRTTLGAHTGWADLANHVLRVHIPLHVPTGQCNDGLCGTWVDGCVETHVNGQIVCFDDSKTHRAFNYSDEERIILIVDIARPNENFPLGTATGSHTNELDSFIKQFT